MYEDKVSTEGFGGFDVFLHTVLGSFQLCVPFIIIIY